MDEMQKLLDAERATTELLASLTRQKEEMDRFGTAKSSLDDAVDQLKTFVNTTKGIATSAAQSVETLKSLGMPEVLDRTAALRGILEGLVQAVQTRFDALAQENQRGSQSAAAEQSKQVGTAMASLREAVEALMRAAHAESLALLDGLGQQSRAQSAEGIAAISSRLEAMQESVRQILTESLAQAAEAQAAISTRLDAMQDGVRQIVAESLAKAAEAQDAKLGESGEQHRKALAATAGATTEAVTAKVASLSAGHEASEKAVRRLGRIVLLQSLVIGVLAVAVGGIVVMHFFPAR